MDTDSLHALLPNSLFRDSLQAYPLAASLDQHSTNPCRFPADPPKVS